MIDFLKQEIQVGDIIKAGYEIGIVYGFTPSGYARYVWWSSAAICAAYQRALGPNHLHADIEVLDNRNIKIQEKRQYTRANTIVVKITTEQMEHIINSRTPYLRPEGQPELNTYCIQKLRDIQQDILNN